MEHHPGDLPHFVLATDEEWNAQMRKTAKAKGMTEEDFRRKYRINGWLPDGDRAVIAPGSSPRFAFSHEMGHWIKTKNPDVWASLRQVVDEALTEQGKAGMEARRERYAGVSSEVEEEFICDCIGEAMENPSSIQSFVSALEAKDAGLDRRVVDTRVLVVGDDLIHLLVNDVHFVSFLWFFLVMIEFC